MTNYRQRRPDPGPRITPEAVTAYRDGDVITLQRELRLPPWHPSPIDAVGQSPFPSSSAGARFWPAAVALREALEAA